VEILAASLIEKAAELGVTVAGLTSVGELLASPSHEGVPILEMDDAEDAVLVLGLHHPPSRPELDWYTGRGGTEGNRILMMINKSLIAWLKESFEIGARDLPYYTEKGGVFLKDAAVLAGLGMVGINNLTIVPGYGPRVRFRGLLVNAPLPPTGRVDYSPCEDCHRPCLTVCPEEALAVGSFDREACLRNMSREGAGCLVLDSSSMDGAREVRFCRICELACPLAASREASL
jgi:epoxyqueuosine reductase